MLMKFIIFFNNFYFACLFRIETVPYFVPKGRGLRTGGVGQSVDFSLIMAMELDHGIAALS